MKSRISSCKAAAFRKDISRFWPVWVGYMLLLMIIQIIQINEDLSYWYAANIGDLISFMGLVNLAFGLVTAVVLFGDLFTPRMCSGIHALPLKREQWFSVHIQTGFLFSIVPTALMAAFSEYLICCYSNMVNGWQLPLYWFAASNMQFLFFFGLAVFCVMCAGTRFAATVVYGIFNFFSTLIYVLVYQLYTPLLNGVVAQYTPFEYLGPVVKLVSLRCIEASRVETGQICIDGFGVEQQEYIGTFTLQFQGWIYTLILAVIGIGLLILARQMYRKRNLECAGDFLAVRWLEPVFQVVFTVLCAAGFHGSIGVFFGTGSDLSVSVLAIGLIVGWFAGRMFLERSTQVFRLKSILGLGLVAVLMAGSMYVTWLDPLGIEAWIPKVGETRSATLRLNYRNGYTTEVPAEIADLTRLHELALEQEISVHPDYDGTFYSPLYTGPNAAWISLEYTATNGWISQRNYYVSTEGESGELLRKYCSRLDILFPSWNVQDVSDLRHEFKDSEIIAVNGIRVAEEYITDDFRNALADAIATDAEAGCLAQSGVFHPQPIVETEDPNYTQYYLTLDIHGVDFWGSLYIYADCENILAVLEPTGVLEAVRQEFENAYG